MMDLIITKRKYYDMLRDGQFEPLVLITKPSTNSMINTLTYFVGIYDHKCRFFLYDEGMKQKFLTKREIIDDSLKTYVKIFGKEYMGRIVRNGENVYETIFLKTIRSYFMNHLELDGINESRLRLILLDLINQKENIKLRVSNTLLQDVFYVKNIKRNIKYKKQNNLKSIDYIDVSFKLTKRYVDLKPSDYETLIREQKRNLAVSALLNIRDDLNAKPQSYPGITNVSNIRLAKIMRLNDFVVIRFKPVPAQYLKEA